MSNQTHKILAVDDDPINLEIMEEILEDYSLQTASCGEDALELAAANPPDLVLLDIMMPGLNGYEVCERLRENPDLRQCKVILVSAKAVTSERLTGYQCGADDYLTKPFDSDELLAKVQVFLRLKSAEEMEALKGELLGLLAHEIRTPLTGILPAGEMLSQEGEMDTEQRRMWGEMVLENGLRLQRLAEKAILLIELRTGNRTPRLQSVDLPRFLHDTARTVEEQHANRSFNIEVEGGSTQARVDEELFGQTLRDILQNAVRFGPEDAPIDIRCHSTGEQIHIAITDYGQGIEQDVLESVFQAFSSRKVEGETVGAGMSMALGREVLQCHEGELQVQSTPGDKTTFIATLPAHVPTTTG